MLVVIWPGCQGSSVEPEVTGSGLIGFHFPFPPAHIHMYPYPTQLSVMDYFILCQALPKYNPNDWQIDLDEHICA